MNPTSTPAPTDTAEQLRAVAQNIETYRVDLGTPKAQFLRTYAELGSDKTYSKITGGDLAQLDIEAWLEKYRNTWSEIQSDDAGGETLLENLSAPTELCRAYLEHRNTRSNARFLPVLAESGCGKSSAVDVLRAKPYGGNVFKVEACDMWKGKDGKGSAVPLLQEIGENLGMIGLPGSKKKLLKVILAKLNERRVCVVIDEAHHLCPQGLNTVKNLINLTPVFVIATAIPVLWERLAGHRSAWAECKQLTGNRLAEKIVLTLKLADVESCIRAAAQDLAKADVLDELVKKAADRLGPEAVSRGNLKFVFKVCEAFRREVDKGQDADLGTFSNAIAQEKKRR